MFKVELRDMSFADAISLFEKKVLKIYNYLKDVHELKLKSCGVSIVTMYPLKDITFNVDNELYDMFLKAARPENYSGLGLTINYKVDSLLFTNILESYESRASGKLKIDDIPNEYKYIQGTKIQVYYPKYLMAMQERGFRSHIIVKEDDRERPINVDDYAQLFNKILSLSIDNAKNHDNKFIFGE